MKAFPNRPFEGGWLRLRIDANCFKLQRGGQIVAVVVIIPDADNTDGRREAPLTKAGACEPEPFRTAILRRQIRRRPEGVKLVMRYADEIIQGDRLAGS